MSDKIELMMLCRVLQSNFSCLSQSESRTQPSHVRISNTSRKTSGNSMTSHFLICIFYLIILLGNPHGTDQHNLVYTL